MSFRKARTIYSETHTHPWKNNIKFQKKEMYILSSRKTFYLEFVVERGADKVDQWVKAVIIGSGQFGFDPGYNVKVEKELTPPNKLCSTHAHTQTTYNKQK